MSTGNGSALNAGESVRSVDQAKALASVITLVRQRFPAAKANLTPWRDDPHTRQWSESESLDLSFHLPGWSPRLQCRSLLMQLRFRSETIEGERPLLGVLMRGMTYDGERWRLATIGDWLPEGPYLPQADQVVQLQMICRDLFELFSGPWAVDEAA